MNKLMAFLSLFRKGQQIANPTLWKSRQITGTMVGVFLIALAQAASAMGYSLPLDEGTAATIGAGIVGLYNLVLTIITSRKAGLPAELTAELPAAEQAGADVQQTVSAAEPPAVVQPISKPPATIAAGDVQAWLDFAHQELERNRQYYGT